MKINSEEDDEYEEYPPIVIDVGGGMMKSGFGSKENDEPLSICQTVVGHSRTSEIEYSDTYFGQQAMLKDTKLSLSRPMKHGIIQNWDDMQLLFEYIISKELKCDEDDIEYSTVVLTETPLNTRVAREKSIQLMFETFKCNSYYTQNSAVFELYSHGQTTGMVAGVGFDTSYTVPIYQGYSLNHAINRMDIGGNNVNEYLCKLLTRKGYNLDNPINNKDEVIEDIKKSLCYVSTDYQQEMKNRETLLWKNKNVIKYTLPDGTELVLGSDRFECSEIFFQPCLIGGHLSKCKSIANYAYDSILSVNIDVRKDITSNICLCGGGTLLNGFVERFGKDLKGVVPASMKLGFRDLRLNRQNSAFIGASLLSSLAFFKDLCVTSEEYEENGPKIVHRKCF